MKLSLLAILVKGELVPNDLINKPTNPITTHLTKSLGSALIGLSFLTIPNAFAVTAEECLITTNCQVVTDTAGLNSVLNSTTSQVTRIVFANDIKLTSDVIVKMVESNRKNIVIDGNGFSLNVGLYDFNFNTATPADWDNNKGLFTFENFNLLQSSVASDEAVVRVNKNTAIDIQFDKINKFSDSMYAVMGVLGDSSQGNQKAEVIFGDIKEMDKFTYRTGHQIVQGGPLRFKGKFDIFTDGSPGTYNTIFWSNVINEYNLMTFESTADLSAKVTIFTLGAANNNNAYKYVMHDGAKFKLHTSTNTFGNSNNGLVLGSYNKDTGFSQGVLLDLANYNEGALNGDSISNLGGDNTGGIGNGAKTNGDVIFNIGTGSKLAYTGTNSAGIKTVKNSNVKGDVYIRSDAALNATNANGIVTTMNGSGNLVLLNDKNGSINAQNGILFSTTSGTGSYEITNKGTINSSINGISLTADTDNATNLILDLTDSDINANAGTGIVVSGNLNAEISGGNINLDEQGSTGISILNKGVTEITNLLLNLNNSVGSGITSNNQGSISITDSMINARNQSTGLSNLANLNLKNLVINATEKANGLLASAGNFATWTIDNLALNVADEANGIILNGGWDFNKVIAVNMDENATGFGLKFQDGEGSSVLTLNENYQFNGIGKNALLISGTTAKKVNQISDLEGNIRIENQGDTEFNLSSSLVGNITGTRGNTILNFGEKTQFNGAISLNQGENVFNIDAGSQTTGSYIGSEGIDVLNIQDNATSDLIFDLGNGDNIVNLFGSAKAINAIKSGSGNDIFNLTGLTSSNSVGQLLGGSGNNILNLSMYAGISGESFNLGLANKWEGFKTANIINSHLILNDLHAATDTIFNLDNSYLTIANQDITSQELKNTIGGSGNVNIKGKINIVSSNENFTGDWGISQSGEATTSLVNAFGSGSILNNGRLSLLGLNTFDNSLSGNGTLAIYDATSFNFAQASANQFAGKVELNRSTITLDDNNAMALKNAELSLHKDAVANINKNTTIGDLSLAGGSLNFKLNGPTDSALLTVNHLDIDSLNNSTLDVAGLINLVPPADYADGTSTNFLDSDSTVSGNAIQLISAQSVSNGDKQLKLAINGDDQLNGIQINDVNDGFGNLVDTIYDYAAVSSNNGSKGAGIYVDVMLKELISKANIVFNNQNSISNSIDTLISGIGGIEIQAKDGQSITITNENNKYEGKTVVTQGTLNIGADNALGNTSELSIADNATVDMLNATLSLLNLTGTGHFNINNGSLTLNEGNFTGSLTSSNNGSLIISDGHVILAGDNQFKGKTTVNSDSRLQIGNGNSMSSYVGNILNNGMVIFNSNLDTIYQANITGEGSLTKDSDGSLFITNNQSYTGDTIINSGSITLSENGSLASNVINNGQLEFAKDTDYEFNQIISGTGNVLLSSDVTTIFNGNNTYSGGTEVSEGKLVLTSSTGAGTGSILVNGALSLDFDSKELGNILSGDGTVHINGKDISLSEYNEFSGIFDVNSDASLNLNTTFGNANYHVQGTLNFTADNDISLSNSFAGTGLINIDSNNHQLSFSNEQNAEKFKGTLSLINTAFDLDELNNREGVNEGTLSIGQGSSVNVGGDYEINDFDIAGGLLNIVMKDPINPNILTVSNLSVDNTNQQGSVNLVGAELSEPEAIDVQKNLLDQNRFDPSTGFLVVKSDTVSTPGQILTLTVDGAGRENITKEIADENGNTIKVTYDYIGIAADKSINESIDQNGLYVTYLLTQVESLSNLVIDASSASYNLFLAKITGQGSVDIKAGGKSLVISNSQNDNTGGTTLSNGTIQLGADQSISSLGKIVLDNAIFDLNGKTQDVTSIDVGESSRLNINNGVLNFNGNEDTSSILGSLFGSGTLNINSGEFILSQANNELEASLNILDDAIVKLNNDANLGSGSLFINEMGILELNEATSLVKNEFSGSGQVNLVSSQATLGGNSENFTGKFNIDENSELLITNLNNIGQSNINNKGALNINLTGLDQVLTQNIIGTGSINKLGSGILRVTNDFTDLGAFNVKGGTLALTDSTAKINSLDISDNSFAGGIGTITGDVTNNGILLVGNAVEIIESEDQVLTIEGNLNNYNIVSLAGTKTGNRLNVLGNYDARSDLIFNTVLEGDDSITDRLSIEGSTSGHTTVFVQNYGGKGAQTKNGIELITVNGDSSGTFALGNRVVAGSYDYQLVQQGTNWYLQSNLLAIRPEIGAYLANIDMANASLENSYSGRINQVKTDKNNVFWGKISGSVTDSRAANSIKQRLYSTDVEIGGNLIKIDYNDANFVSGIYSAISSGHSSNISDVTDFSANSSQDNYRMGVYGTYLTNIFSIHNPSYIDGSLQYAWLHNEVKAGDLNETQKYDANALGASIEIGTPVNVYSHSNQYVDVIPQAQLIYKKHNADNITETNGTQITHPTVDGLVTRLGAEVRYQTLINKDIEITGYTGINWIHDDVKAVVNFDDNRYASDKPSDLLDIKLGFNMSTLKYLSTYAEINTQHGKNEYNDVKGTIGLRYDF
ncbi:autotransporter outer membrane beta-barrel domain-containing protein [Thorsellia anophelis]|uniref:Outer membrane autotransporter barrel domain-containing protein n=1 Tax=Thorsellia anophelis DSM 18579 TaxID=1123402 RepID=A0A1I0DBW0_9GAMM|nr:autotransporter outer membrane beta-barrel domain-containing protein [Thorsellia anophelis]SET29788.1 outer membrane autotransporter barrel domain-containing protein [Thorsellia anophelis DSM 18579]